MILGDFHKLLTAHSAPTPAPSLAHPLHPHPAPSLGTEATTVLAFHYNAGLLIGGDRRATAGNTILYDRADKLLELDADTLMAIAGSPATATEMARTLSHGFQYFRRSQLQPLSAEAKVRALSQLLRNNVALALQGIGTVVPILALRQGKQRHLYFYDAMGAQFQATEFATSGSGSPSIRSLIQWHNRWHTPTRDLDEEAAVRLALQALDIAAELDSATGGVDRRAQVFPIIKLLRDQDLVTVPDDRLRQLLLETPHDR